MAKYQQSDRKVFDLLTVILLSPLNVNIGDIFGWNIKGVPNEGFRLWPRWIGSELFLGHQILPQQQPKDEKHCD